MKLDRAYKIAVLAAIVIVGAYYGFFLIMRLKKRYEIQKMKETMQIPANPVVR